EPSTVVTFSLEQSGKTLESYHPHESAGLKVNRPGLDSCETVSTSTSSGVGNKAASEFKDLRSAKRCSNSLYNALIAVSNCALIRSSLEHEATCTKLLLSEKMSFVATC